VRESRKAVEGSHPRSAVYSFKTDPDQRLLRFAREYGFFAEVISQEEHAWSRLSGFSDASTIYNGPRPLLTDSRIYAAFADSVESFTWLLQTKSSSVIGIRIRPPEIPSRFGIRVPDDLDDMVAALRVSDREQALGISFHLTHSEFERRTWFELASNVMDVAADLERRSERRFKASLTSGEAGHQSCGPCPRA